jgi:prepilin-type N-terminal cleavage/methylation domain-containing protein
MSSLTLLYASFLKLSRLKLTSRYGLTLIEVLLTMSIFAILLGFISLGLSNMIPRASLHATGATLIADLRQQQQKAMAGEAQGAAAVVPLGVRFEGGSYVLFQGESYLSSLPASHFRVTVQEPLVVESVFPNNEVVFASGTGDIQNYSTSNDQVIVRNTETNVQQTITFNRYGIITNVE